MRSILLKVRYYILLLFIILTYLAILNGKITLQDISILCRQAGILSFAVLGVAILQISGELNICSGAQIALTVSIAEYLKNNYNIPISVIVLFTFVVALLIGITLGLLNLRVEIPTIILTFAMEYILRDTSKLLFSKISNSTANVGGFTFLAYGSIWGIPCWFYFFTLIFLFVSVLLHKTYIGRCFYAAGSDAKAAVRSGLPVKTVKFAAFLLGSVLINITALFMLSRVNFTSFDVASSTSVDILVILCLSGISFRGGKGNVSGLILGTIGFTLVNSFFYLVTIPAVNLQITKAAILLITIWLQNNRKRKLISS